MPRLRSLTIQDDSGGISFELRNKCESEGLVFTTREFMSVETLNVSTADGKHLFWIAAWEDDWIVCLNGPRFFRLESAQHVLEFFAQLLKRASDSSAKFEIDESLRGRFRVNEIAKRDWFLAIGNRLREQYAQLGWIELSKSESATMWERATNQFQLSANAPTLPEPSRTWNIQHAMNLSDDTDQEDEFVRDLQTKSLAAMRMSGSDTWYALDFNHACYQMNLSVLSSGAYRWPVSIFPDDDEALFFASDSLCGIKGSLQTSITFFGQPLVSAIVNDQPDVFG
jgi:hypothetical protein